MDYLGKVASSGLTPQFEVYSKRKLKIGANLGKSFRVFSVQTKRTVADQFVRVVDNNSDF